MAAQGPFWAQITYIFSFHGGTGNNETIHIPKEHLARIYWTSNLRIVARNCYKFRYFGYSWRFKVHFELKLPIYLVFMVALAIMKPFAYLKNTLHEFLGPLASGLWPENTLTFDILAIYGGSRSFLGDDACSFRFEISSGKNYDSSITIGTFRDFFGPVAVCIWPESFQNING